MLGLTRLPPWFEKEFARFESVFSDSRNVDSFTALTSAVILAKTQWTVSGLSRGISRPDAKSARAYRYFLGGADWSAIDLAQQQAAYVFEQLDVGAGDEILLHVDDTFSVRLDHAQEAYHVETMLDLFEEIGPSLPRVERRARVRERVRELSWSSVANFIITSSEIVDPLD